jgi:hypothetical protein
MSQTFDVFDRDGDGNTVEQGANWGYGSHFMIGDTNSGLGYRLYELELSGGSQQSVYQHAARWHQCG